ncbi:hypothetical protein LSH36_1241g00027 [Paralvinella palmiformis]|uniref:G-protein coupled receptors family 1 profile domain-containing protein n=1 Tax=Paralvinella palmiformis TaxID=53620 RepID=A0AAD9ITX9_9ANNE|nr:hypothetical protein LSH36_1241g00027 [Paralvinella palmiformis]
MMITSVTFTLLVSLLSLTVSGLLVVTIVHAKFYRLRQNAFVLLMSSFDCLRAMSLFARSVLFLAPSSTGNGSICDVIEFLHTWSSVGCVLGVFTVVYDRLAYLIGPVTYADRMSIRLAVSLNAYVISHSLFCAILPLIGWGEYLAPDVNATGRVYCVVNWSGRHGYGYFLLIFGYVIPLLAVLITTAKLGRVVRTRIKFVKVYSDPATSLWPMRMRAASDQGRLTELDTSYVTIWRAVMTSSVMCSACWLLYILAAALMTKGNPPGVASVTATSVSLVMSSLLTHVTNFLVFGIYNKRYRLDTI